MHLAWATPGAPRRAGSLAQPPKQTAGETKGWTCVQPRTPMAARRCTVGVRTAGVSITQHQTAEVEAGAAQGPGRGSGPRRGRPPTTYTSLAQTSRSPGSWTACTGRALGSEDPGPGGKGGRAPAGRGAGSGKPSRAMEAPGNTPSEAPHTVRPGPSGTLNPEQREQAGGHDVRVPAHASGATVGPG